MEVKNNKLVDLSNSQLLGLIRANRLVMESLSDRITEIEDIITEIENSLK